MIILLNSLNSVATDKRGSSLIDRLEPIEFGNSDFVTEQLGFLADLGVWEFFEMTMHLCFDCCRCVFDDL